jgi:hypothetical protein
MTADELKAGIVLSSIQLRRLGQNKKPTGCGSGCLIHYTGKLLVLTVAHVTGDFNNWAIQVEWIPSFRRTQLYQIGQMNFLAKLSFDTKAAPEIDFEKAERLDFSYAVLKEPVTPLYQEIEPDGTVKNSIGTLTLETALDCVPNSELEYLAGNKRNYVWFEELLELPQKFAGKQLFLQVSSFRLCFPCIRPSNDSVRRALRDGKCGGW